MISGRLSLTQRAGLRVCPFLVPAIPRGCRGQPGVGCPE